MAKRSAPKRKARKPAPGILAEGTLWPRGRQDPDPSALHYVFRRDDRHVVRLSLVVEPGTCWSREAWVAVWTLLKADFKTLSEMGKRRRRLRRKRYRTRRRARLRQNPRQKAPATVAAAKPADVLPSGDLVAVAAEKLATKEEGTP